MKYFFLIFSIALISTKLRAQEVDTLLIQKLVNLEKTIDSLRQRTRALDDELQRVKVELAEGDNLDKLLAAFNSEAVESAPEDQRSRRKRVDALLKAITEQPGQLRFNGGATAIVQGNLNRGNRFATGVGSFDIFAHTSFGKHTLLFFDFEAIGGNGPNDHIPTLAALNGDAGSTQNREGVDQLTVLEAWAEFTAFNQALTATVGKIDLTNYFDNNASANDETSQFISAAFVNSAALPAPGNSPGLRLRTTVLKRFFVQAAVASADNAGDNLFEELFRIGSMGVKIFPQTDWEANLRIYGYQHPAADDAKGYGLSFDESISGAFNIFARYNKNEDKLAERFGIASAWSLGARLVKTVAGRRLALAAAYGETAPHGNGLRTEKIGEIYARRQLNKWVYLSPHVQRIWNAAGLPQTATLIGLRTHFNF